jgi:D-cysteine desulfhydrase family pyridoxal phosphate-dependent enzyme
LSIHSLPRLQLASLPTPLHEVPRLRAALGGPARAPRILIKRDDCTGLALGGNKVRKLEFLVAEAQRQGATFLVTSGAAQSNHARMTAAAARVAGMGSALILSTNDERAPAQGNLLLDRMFGAEVHFVPESDDPSRGANDAEAAAIEGVLDELRARGERPYLIPVGGSNAVGTCGYVAGTLELVEQLWNAGEAPTRLYYASGSRGTQAGLALGAKIYNAPYEVRGIAVSGGDAEKTPRARQIANEAAELLGAAVRITTDDLFTDEGQIGSGYGIPTAAGLEAISLLARCEGILLDPVYTGKAMAGLIHDARRGVLDPNDTVVFLHTGGMPALFAHGERLLTTTPNHVPELIP